MIRSILNSLVTCVIFSVPALAGPITFEYKTSSAVQPQSPHGSINVDVLQGGPVYFNEYGGFFTIGWVRFGQHGDDGPNAVGHFELDVEVNDDAGHHGALTLSGNRQNWWNHISSTQLRTLSNEDDSPGKGWSFYDSELLGDNLVYVTASISKEEGKAEILLGVVPTIHATPEPGTLLLGTAALLPVGLRLLRRRV